MDLIGTTVNARYQLNAVLGSGGMATVYRAHDQLLSRDVALKLLAPELLDRANIVSRFEAEANAMLRLHHPNVVAVFDVGDAPQPFIVMELVNGGSVRDLLENAEAPNRAQAMDIIDGVLSGLINIHASGTIHRDIKPANILLTSTGVPKLTDFGIARASDQNPFQTHTGTIMGTPAFMAPEQQTSATLATEASDLYAVGATLYALLTGRSTRDLYVREKQEEAFRDLQEELRTFLAKACSFNASERFANASEMQASLRTIGKTQNPKAPKTDASLLSRHFNNLPQPREAFVGRADELEQLEAWCDSNTSQVISLVGLGGIGKSRLALEFCRRKTQHFDGGIWRINLATVKTKSELHRALGSALGLQLDGTQPFNEIVRSLHTKTACLLLFDNAEDARPVLRPTLMSLVERVPTLHVIVTTREALNASWEAVLTVKDLDLRASVALIMQAVAHTFVARDEPTSDLSAFEDIARLLEGHPLSLELAAAQLELLAPAQLYSRLSRSLRTVVPSEGPNLVGLLDTAWTAAPSQSSVQASLAWSWSLLGDAEKTTLAQCALFADGFDLEAAEVVVELPPQPQPPLMVILQALRTRNLIRIRTPYRGNRRLSVPRLVGAFALAHGNPAELHDAELRMAAHYARMGHPDRIHGLQTGGIHRRRIAKLEIPNIQHCFEWTMEHQHTELSVLLSLATSALLRNSGPFDGVTAMLRRAKTGLSDDSPLYARLLVEQGRLASNREGLDVAERLLKECISLADTLQLPSEATQARVYLAYVFSRTKRMKTAIPMAKTAVEIATEADEQNNLPTALYCRGYLTYKSGETRKASTDLQAALRGFQRMGDRVREGICFGNLGEYHHYVGDVQQAKQCYENARAIAMEQEDKASLVRGYRRLAWLHMDAGDWVHAEDAVRSGLRVAQELGDLPGEASMVGTLGTVAASAGKYEVALDQFEQADRMYQLHGSTDQRHSCRINICMALEKLDRIDEAFELINTLKAEKEMTPFARHFVSVIEMKLHIRRENWHTAIEIGDEVMAKLEDIQAWDRTISVHAYRAICAAALGDDPEPHITKAKTVMTRLNLADGSQEGVLIAETTDQIRALQYAAQHDDSR